MYTYKAIVRSVYDGDTFRADLKLGFGIEDKGSKGKGRSFRLYGINTPEVRGVEKEEGKRVRDYVRTILKKGSTIVVHSLRDASGKYGRYLAIVYTEALEESLNDHLVAKGMATRIEY